MSVLATLNADTRLALWGYGREGVATRRFLEARVPGLTPTVIVDAPVETALDLPQLTGAAGSTAIARGAFEVIVKSPGISLYRPEVAAAQTVGSRLTSSTNLWFETGPERFVLAVTGTKGKSTTASLIAHLWRGVDADVALAGNVGVPLITLPAVGPPLVLELSSYQIADLAHGPDLMVLTNLFPEHRDWHRTHDAYFRDKLRLLDLAGRALLNGADPRTVERLGSHPHAAWYGTEGSWHARADGVYLGSRRVFAADDWPIPGLHNLRNLAAALAALDLALDGGSTGVVADLAPRATSFRGLDHRLEILGERDGVLWVNDSISTTPESAAAALAAFPDRPLTLLLGGHERGQDPAPLAAASAGRALQVVTMPDNGPRLGSALRDAEPTLAVAEATNLEEAVAKAAAQTPAGGAVLLSPAAPSYGRFRDFEARGDAFAALAGFSRGR